MLGNYSRTCSTAHKVQNKNKNEQTSDSLNLNESLTTRASYAGVFVTTLLETTKVFTKMCRALDQNEETVNAVNNSCTCMETAHIVFCLRRAAYN